MKLPTDQQIKRILAILREEGVPIGKIDILETGVSVSTIAEDKPETGSAYDSWKKQDHDRAAPCKKAA